jgi:glycerophosphoryl diester phosphodiesterase
MLVLGHRGGRGEGWPTENTLAAFERSKREGADGIEIDVRLCGTGEVVVFHDPGRGGRLIEDTPLSELHLPRLEDVIDFCSREALMLNVEIKYDLRDRRALVRSVCAVLAGSRLELIVSSFDPRILWRARAMGLRAPTAWLTDAKQRYSMPLARVIARRPVFSGVHLSLPQATDARIQRLRRRGLLAGVWTVNDANEARRLADAGASWIISDSPGEMKAALAGSVVAPQMI